MTVVMTGMPASTAAMIFARSRSRRTPTLMPRRRRLLMSRVCETPFCGFGPRSLHSRIASLKRL